MMGIGSLLTNALAAGLAVSADTVAVRVDLSRSVRTGADRVVGINLNYLRDADENRVAGARPLRDALEEMGARWLRFPGGEKSNFHRWSVPPYDRPAPQALEWYASVEGAKLDFDAYMRLVRETGAEPFVVVGFDPTGRSERTKQQWIDDAVAWVRYANVTRGYGVRYWEVGNENWGEKKLPPRETGRIVREFAAAMKAVDPTIWVGSNGQAGSEAWWGPFLSEAGTAIDFVSISMYNAWEWKGYDRWLRDVDLDLIADARSALRLVDTYLPEGKRGRMPLLVTETNSKDYSPGGWAADNNLGHGLVTFETLARLAGEPRVASAMLWNTRWVNDAEAGNNQLYALGPGNELMPSGRAVQLWAAFALPHTVPVTVAGGSGFLAAYATTDAGRENAVVWVVNRSAEPQNVRVELSPSEGWSVASMWRWSGTGPDDRNPVWATAEAPPLHGSWTAAACSVTVLRLERR